MWSMRTKEPFWPLLDQQSNHREESSVSRRELELQEEKSRHLKSLILRLKSNDPSLERLSFFNYYCDNGINLNSEDIAAIAKALEHNYTLKSLDLGYNAIGDTGVTAIVKALKSNRTLSTLGLSFNRIGFESADTIVSLLHNNNTLRYLHLGTNQLGSKGAIAISDAIEANNTLKLLDLGSNDIDLEGVAAISRALKNNCALKTLGLGENRKIGSNGATIIASALTTNHTLETLDLHGCNIESEGVRAITDALQHNDTLTLLEIGERFSGFKFTENIEKNTLNQLKAMLEKNRIRAKSIVLSKKQDRLNGKARDNVSLAQNIVNTTQSIVPQQQPATSALQKPNQPATERASFVPAKQTPLLQLSASSIPVLQSAPLSPASAITPAVDLTDPEANFFKLYSKLLGLTNLCKNYKLKLKSIKDNRSIMMTAFVTQLEQQLYINGKEPSINYQSTDISEATKRSLENKVIKFSRMLHSHKFRFYQDPEAEKFYKNALAILGTVLLSIATAGIFAGCVALYAYRTKSDANYYWKLTPTATEEFVKKGKKLLARPVAK